MYTDEHGDFISSNNLVAICCKPFSTYYYGTSEGKTEGHLMICEDTVLVEYKAYFKPLDRYTPSLMKLDTPEDKIIGATMMYGDTYNLEEAKIYFPHIDFVEGGYFKGIRERMPELFI